MALSEKENQAIILLDEHRSSQDISCELFFASDESKPVPVRELDACRVNE